MVEMPSFSFLGNAAADDPSSQQAMLMRQKIALALLGRSAKGYPKTVGEGLTALGEGIGEGYQQRAAQNALAAFEKYHRENAPPVTTDTPINKTSDAGTTVAPVVAADEDAPPERTVAALPNEPPQAAPVAPPVVAPPVTPQPYAPTAALDPGNVASDAPPITGAPVNPQLRDNIARTLMTAPGVPQQNPTLAAGDGQPSTPPMPATAALAGAPREAADNPPITFPVGGTQVAQAGPAPSIPQINRITPPVNLPGTEQPKLPPPAEWTKQEIDGYKLLSLGQRTMNTVLQEQGKTLIDAGKAAREKIDAYNKSKFEADTQLYHARALAQEAAERGAVKTQQGIIVPPGAAPAQADVAGPGRAGPAGVDPRLNTPQSPQRVGLPDVSKVPPGVTPEQWATQQVPIATKAVEAVQTAVPQFKEAIKTLQLARDHPGRGFGLGITSNIARSIPGTDAYDFGQVMNQIAGKNFLSAYATLKGGGQISNVEGGKAEQAQARLSTAQTKEGFDKALLDFETALRTDLEIAQRKVNQPVTAWQLTPDSKFAPDIGTIDTRPGKTGTYEYLGGNPTEDSSYRRVR